MGSAPLQGAELQAGCKLLWPPQGGAVFLPGGCSIDEYGSVLLSSTGGESSPPHSPVSPHRRTVSQSCVLCFDQNSAFTLAVSEVFYLRCRTKFQNSELYGLLQSQPALFLQESVSPCFHHLLDRPGRVTIQPPSVSQFMSKQSRKPAPILDALSQLLCSSAWAQDGTQVPPVLATQELLRPQGHTWDSALLHHPSTFKPGTFPTKADF